MKFVNELIKRLSLPTPAFFAKIRNFGLILSAVGGGLLGMEVSGSKFLPILQSIAPDVIVVGMFITLIAQATAKPEQPNKDL